jgi:cytoskeletal protein CcmA (bactofilin family)
MTPRLVIEEGAVLEGGCTMLKAREAHEKRETEARSQYGSASTSAYQKTETAEIDEDDEFLGTAAEEEEEEAAETAAL